MGVTMEVKRTKLGAKTGCLTCRNRRKKCDETSPACNNCTSSLRRCQWPTSDDLIDRRHATHRSRQSTSPTSTSYSSVGDDGSPSSTNANSHVLVRRPSFTKDATPAIMTADLCRLSEATAHKILCHDMESVIFRHFSDRYYALLILPNCNPAFFWGWINDIRKLMVQYKSLQYSVLACGASHLHFVDASSMMQELSLTYYSNSLKGLSELLGGVSQLEDNNGVLMSVMLLYLHGCMGRGTYTDIPRHVNAAMRILRLRLLSKPSNISRPFDRLAIESVLYQVFLVVTGPWSDPFELDLQFDAEFWLQAELLLAKSNLYPDRSISFNSPVIGVPLALFRIVISLKKIYQTPWEHDEETLHKLRNEVEEWEGIVLSDGETDQHFDDEEYRCSPDIYRDAAYLYVLVSSLLMDQISIGEWTPGIPQVAPSDSWQLKKAIQILETRKDDPDWSKCFIGNWPVYSLGFFLDSPEGIELVRNDMQQRWDVVKFSQIMRFRKDLEATWAARGSVPSTSVWSESVDVITAKAQTMNWIDAIG